MNELEVLRKTTENLAEVIKDLRLKMTGKGVSPLHSPLFESKLSEVELKLRTIGSKWNELVPEPTRIDNLRLD